MAKYYIDTLIDNTIRCANRMGYHFGIEIVAAKDTNKGMIGNAPYYHLLNGKGGGVYMRCADTNVRNIIFHFHFFMNRNVEKYCEPNDFFGGIKN